MAIGPFVCEKKRFAQKFTDGRTDDGRRAIALAHSCNELKKLSQLTVGVDCLLQEMMKIVDTSGDGKIDKNEFIKFFSA